MGAPVPACILTFMHTHFRQPPAKIYIMSCGMYGQLLVQLWKAQHCCIRLTSNGYHWKVSLESPTFLHEPAHVAADAVGQQNQHATKKAYKVLVTASLGWLSTTEACSGMQGIEKGLLLSCVYRQPIV
eukprot:1158688-Pelagomonas_calceolata.AAC.10